MKKKTMHELIVIWLGRQVPKSFFFSPPSVITSRDIEVRLPQWAANVHGRYHTPSNWSRRFREVKSLPRFADSLAAVGIGEIRDIGPSRGGSRVGRFELRPTG